MLHEPTVEKLKALNLEALLVAWQGQQADPKIHELGFDERLGLLVEAEWLARENRRLKRALAEAKLKQAQACLEDVEYSAKRQIDRSLLRQLATCRWVADHQQILITGAAGTGKTYLGCALAQQACRRGYRALYRRASRLFHELKLAHADGTFPRLLARFARMDVLVIDDLFVGAMGDAHRDDLLEVLDDRYGSRATVVTSQLDPGHWHQALGEPTVADAICERLLHGAHRVKLKGPSRRPTEAKEEPETLD